MKADKSKRYKIWNNSVIEQFHKVSNTKKVYVLTSQYDTSDNLWDMTGEIVTEQLGVFSTLAKAKKYVEEYGYATDLTWHKNANGDTVCCGSGSWAKHYTISEKFVQ